ncbi:MAG: AsnC family transcriptional regulator [Propionibacteriaceae bacterium]|nr:AsnC family transcriptional regulator [Propionibacteriaceae bacterium]
MAGAQNDGRSDGVNAGRTVRLDGVDRLILQELARDPTLTAARLAAAARKSQATVERRLAKLRKAALAHRRGSTKNGVWAVSPNWQASIDGAWPSCPGASGP